jgi:transposase
MSAGNLKLLMPGIREKILDALSKGASYGLAANCAGCCREQLRFWRKRGKDQFNAGLDRGEGDLYLDFYLDVIEAQGKAAVKWLEKIDNAAEQGAWQAAAWKLERRYPEEYGRDKQEIEGEVKKNTEELKNMRELITKCMKPQA